jgi:hypothetical protein
LLVDETEYSHMQVPLVITCCRQMAPASVTIQLDQNRMLFTSGCNRIFLDAGAFHCKKALAPVTIQFLNTACFLLADETEYSRVKAPLVVVHCQIMAPESSVTTQSHQNHIVFTSR